MISQAELESLIRDPEGYRLECKRAEQRFDFERLARYAAALANEGGGYVLLGVTDQRPREIVGTSAFPEPGAQSASLYQRLGLRVDVQEFRAGGKRVIAFEVPSRAPGQAVSLDGAYWMRAGESLVPMSDDRLREIHQEREPDFSAETCPGLTASDLDAEAVSVFRERWRVRTGNDRFAGVSTEQLLADAGLITRDGGVTFAALLLLGTPEATRSYLPAAELIYEYRATEAAGPAQDRIEFCQGFLLTSDPLWTRMNARNDRQSIQVGFFRQDIPTFDERVVREAVLNAVAHRDYRSPRSVFVRQFSRRLEVVSPGGFPAGVTEANILTQQHPRNRLLADALSRAGLVERAGQGVNLMIERSVQQGKDLPSYAGTSAHEVRLTLAGLVTSPALLAGLERVEEEQLRSFSTEDFVVLDRLQRGQEVTAELRPRLPVLREMGILESVGRGRSVRYFLSRRLSAAIGQAGVYTRRRGLDHGANKELLVEHLRQVGARGSDMAELQQVLPALSRHQVQRLLSELREAGRVRMEGERRWARWLHYEA